MAHGGVKDAKITGGYVGSEGSGSISAREPQSSFSSNAYSANANDYEGTITLYRGTTPIASVAYPAGNFALECVGTAIKVWASGVLVCSVTDSMYSVSGWWGAWGCLEEAFVSYDGVAGSMFPRLIMAGGQ